MNNLNANSIFLKKCDVSEIVEFIKTFQQSKACGPNNIPTNLIKLSIDILTPIIVILVNSGEGIFHDLLKVARVCPIYKKKETYKCEYYRPISLLSNISKIFERIMYSRVSNFLESFDVIYKYQFGFRKKTLYYSCSTKYGRSNTQRS